VRVQAREREQRMWSAQAQGRELGQRSGPVRVQVPGLKSRTERTQARELGPESAQARQVLPD